MIDRIGWRLLRLLCQAALARRLDLRVEGLEYLPRRGPLLIAARHYHHLYDGGVLLAMVPRQLHPMVGLDWVQDRRLRGLMEALCASGRWPAVLRRDRGGQFAQPASIGSAYRAEEGGRYLRRALRLAADLLGEGQALLVFPEGYPNVDPVFTPKTGDDDMLPFREGFAKLALLAQRGGSGPVPVVPAGFAYRRDRRWQVTLRFGPPRSLAARAHLPAFVREVEAEVRRLSASEEPAADVGAGSATGRLAASRALAAPAVPPST